MLYVSFMVAETLIAFLMPKDKTESHAPSGVCDFLF